MASANSRPSTPEVCRASASVPAKGPRPAAISSSAAHTSSGTERSAFSSRRVGARPRAASPSCRRLAGSASASPPTAASSVPSADIASVSQVPTSTLCRKGPERSGGKNSARKRPMLRAASSDRNCAHCRSRLQKLATTSASTAAVNQQALQRASNNGGGRRWGTLAGEGCVTGAHPKARRSPALMRSASATRATKTASIVSTSPPLNIFIELSICWPKPPAPTKPSTTELRMAHSQR